VVCSAAPDPVAPSDPNVQNQPVPGRQTAEERWAIDHLVVVAGPPAVGKSRLIRRLARDDLLRERLGVPKDAPALAARAVPRRRPTAHEALILHYDLLRLLHQAIPAYECDPGLSLLGSAARITFLTVRTSPDRLRAQLEQRAAAPDRPPRRQAFHRTLRALYEDDGFVRGWYERWLEFVGRYDAVTIRHSFVEVDDVYALTPVPHAAVAAAGLSRAAAARPT